MKTTPDNGIVTVRLKYADEIVQVPIVVKPGEHWELTLYAPNRKSLKWVCTVDPTLKKLND